MTDLLSPPADRDLLRAFADRADQEAFAELVRRHGGLVLGACRRVLNDAPDADDVFQAVFLVLARKAGAIRSPEQLGNWLYGVAIRCAKRARARTAKRWAREQPVTEVPSPAPGGEPAEWRDVQPVLDEEIARLPEKLRSAVVLCELEGVNRADAAARLGVPEGTLSSRLARGKEALRRRLLKRGVALSAIGVGILLSQAAPAAVPPALAASTVSAAIGFAAGGSVAAGAVAAGLASTEIKLMVCMKAFKIGLAAILVAAGSSLAVGVYRQVAAAEDKKTDQDKLQGEWKITSAKFDGRDTDHLATQTVTFNGDKVTFHGEPGTFKLDAKKDPKQIDLTIRGPMKEGLHPGLYKFDGEKLIMHVACADDQRPTTFECKEGAGSILAVMERVKK